MKTCDYCGRENPDDALNCAGCASQLQAEAPVVKMTKVGFWTRAAARIVDALFVGLLSIFAGCAIGVMQFLAGRAGILSIDSPHSARGLSLVMLAFGVLADIAYHTLCEGLHGASLGKLCCGICVVQQDGGPSNLTGALIRSLAYFIDTMFFGVVGYMAMSKSSLNQRYGDAWGKTAVVANEEIALESRRTAGCLMLALGLGIGAYLTLIAAGILLRMWEV